MLRSMIESVLNLRFLVVILAVVAMLAGAAQLRQMPVDILPEFSPPYVEIRTEALGLSAEEVEQLITTPMEQDLLAGVPWLDSIHSQSLEGLSSIVLVFEPGIDVIRARQMVGERLAQAFALPIERVFDVAAHPGIESVRLLQDSLLDLSQMTAQWSQNLCQTGML